MSMSVDIIENAPEIRNPILILSVPGAGLVGTISADHLIRIAGLDEVGKIDSPFFPPVVEVREGIASHTVKIFSGRGIYVVKVEIPLPVEPLTKLTEAVLDWITKKRPKLVLVIGGIPDENRVNVERPQVMTVFSSEEAKVAANKIGGELMKGGYLSGYAAYFLREAIRRGIPAAAVMVQSFDAYPDPGAAAELLKAIEPALGFNIDISQLEAESETIRLKMKELMAKTLQTVRETPTTAYIG
ncbi:MAG: PAC2 family protein [Candidatus Korarchaeum sp.]|nr:PAC2 family protein [Candidatus Korarchaeum sp.]MDW8036361.1 PAC2 family protein [Candidatus Korarchaeum sp.]